MEETNQYIKKAGFLPRSLAFFIDLLIIIIFTCLFSNNIGLFFRDKALITLNTTDSIWKGTIPMIVGFYGQYAYCLPFSGILVFLPELFGAQTFGKMIFKLKIKDKDGDETKITSHIIRSFLKNSFAWFFTLSLLMGNSYLAGFAVILLIITICTNFMVLGRSKMTLYDRLSNTSVFRENKN